MNELYKVSEVKLSYRTSKLPKIQINNSKKCYKILLDNWENGGLEHRESFKVVLLNQAKTILGIYNAAEGGITNTPIDIRIVLQSALLANACSIILAHNHPSGTLTPSMEDIAMTRRTKEAAALLNIGVDDHIIVCRDGYYSMADRGDI